jgi:hypothetical protein
MFPELDLGFVSGAVEGKRDIATEDEEDKDGKKMSPFGEEEDGGGEHGPVVGLDDSDEELMETVANLGLHADEREE